MQVFNRETSVFADVHTRMGWYFFNTAAKFYRGTAEVITYISTRASLVLTDDEGARHSEKLK